MARLKVLKGGLLFGTLNLVENETYLIGRGADVQLQIEEGPGISRHHLNLKFHQSVWIVELISRVGELYLGSEKVSMIELTGDMTFRIPPYDFIFTSATSQPEEISQGNLAVPIPDSGNTSSTIDAGIDGNTVSRSPVRTRDGDSVDESAGHEPIEKTSVSRKSLTALLKIVYPDQPSETFRLEGHLWSAGREEINSIHLKHVNVSRKHFEINQVSEGFYITDLGSANGTFLNGEKLAANQPHSLQSGDEISILNLHMHFQIRDEQFKNQLALIQKTVPKPIDDPGHQNFLEIPGGQWPAGSQRQLESYASGQSGYPEQSLQHPPMSWGDDPNAFYPEGLNSSIDPSPHQIREISANRNQGRQRFVRILLILLIPVAGYIFLSDDTSKKSKIEKTDSASLSEGKAAAFETLSVEQKNSIRDSFQLARNLYVSGKYELCLSEIRKIHELVPVYEESKDLQTFCEQGSLLLLKKQDMDRVEGERINVENQIKSITAKCKESIQTKTTVAEVQTCLGPAMALDPENPAIVEVMSEIQRIEGQRSARAEDAAELAKKERQARQHFQKAQGLKQEGKLALAAKEFQSFLNANYSGTSSQRDVARREIVELGREIQLKVKVHTDSCKSLISESRYREANKSCLQAIAEDPQNPEAQELRKSLLAAIRKEMRAIYEESIIEEGLGNVDSARQKWRQIMEKDLPKGEYYNKAKRQLEKYENGVE